MVVYGLGVLWEVLYEVSFSEVSFREVLKMSLEISREVFSEVFSEELKVLSERGEFRLEVLEGSSRGGAPGRIEEFSRGALMLIVGAEG